MREWAVSDLDPWPGLIYSLPRCRRGVRACKDRLRLEAFEGMPGTPPLPLSNMRGMLAEVAVAALHIH
jgi:hypothetical protein